MSATANKAAIARRNAYDELLSQHPMVKALGRPATLGSAKPAAGVPALIAEAMQDPHLAKVITTARAKHSYENAVDDLARQRLAKAATSRDGDSALIRQGGQVEHDLHATQRAALRRGRLDPARIAYAAATADHPVPGDILADVPSHLHPAEQDAMTYVGWAPDHPMWHEMFTPDADRPTPDKTGAKTADLIERLEGAADRIDYDRAPRHLIEKGVLTLGGNQSYQDLVMFLIFLLVVLPFLVEPFREANESLFEQLWHSVFG
jgi:hypothetical protein